ncbi:5-formyltetrahydrofolate cyclo-ligase [Actinomadura craniellae]|uniref:5-formyltetrahydrofolate cyclo-ligase n=1 Tax=Actinomadura craniellae TaxID=2231787 RepID=A0A365H7D6_9ACTN|nr:5-formyltetrahydrofolate cyclo-ligase [Actinomadura craniellae]RAY15034.1 5-formyltetrahydrofolate cyclo-ligase [Actinomadura craniellae]
MQDIGFKQKLRTRVIRDRAGLHEKDRASAGRAIRETLLTLPELEMASSIAAYVSIDTEPDTRALIFGLWKRGAYVLLPRLLPDNDLDWATYEGPDSLAPGRHGLPEPTSPGRGPGAVKAADVVIVPALAIDRTGMRLGRGGGSYDRVLDRVGPGILTVGLVYDGELVEEVPAEPHDRRVRAAITPSEGLIRFD